MRLFACGREGEMADPVLLHAILTTGHAGHLRAGELCRRERRADTGFVVNDVRWAADCESFVLRLGITKTSREQGGDFVTISVPKAVRAMRLVFNQAPLPDAEECWPMEVRRLLYVLPVRGSNLLDGGHPARRGLGGARWPGDSFNGEGIGQSLSRGGEAELASNTILTKFPL